MNSALPRLITISLETEMDAGESIFKVLSARSDYIGELARNGEGGCELVER